MLTKRGSIGKSVMASWSPQDERRELRFERAAKVLFGIMLILGTALLLMIIAEAARAQMSYPSGSGLDGAQAVSHGAGLGSCHADLIHYGVAVDGVGPAVLGYDPVSESRTVNGEPVPYSFDPAPSRDKGKRFLKLAGGYVLDTLEMEVIGPCWVTPLPVIHPDPDLIERWLALQIWTIDPPKLRRTSF